MIGAFRREDGQYVFHEDWVDIVMVKPICKPISRNMLNG